MSDAPARVRPSSAKRPKAAAAKRDPSVKSEAALAAEFEAMMARSDRQLEQLNANLDALLVRLRTPRLTS